MTRNFVINPSWSDLLQEFGARPADILRAAGLPEDLFTRARPTLPPEKFNRLFGSIVSAIDHEASGLILGQAPASGTLSPALFAASCSADLTAAARRLAQYMAFAGPLKLEDHSMAGGLELTFEGDPEVTLPDEFIAAELVALVSLARNATRHTIRPFAVEMVNPPAAPAYADFFGHPVYPGPFNRVVFSPADARRPFLPPKPVLFDGFDPDLRIRMDELDRIATVADRVRSVLMEAMPAGVPEVNTVARRLGISARTLQRKLGAEGTSFQQELRDLRERLARHYLQTTMHTSAEISFLLGYDDPNSFTRAFHHWTGTTPEAFRSGT